jgi:prepilin peptidase CpaA
VLAVVMIAVRGKFRENLANARAIVGDLLAPTRIGAAAEKAAKRKPRMHLLPYGIPLCLGFLGFLAYYLWAYPA